jgi:predicted chitinase
MLPEVLGKLFEPVDVRTAMLIARTAYQEHFAPHQVAFFAAQLAVDSDGLRFQVEPWSPDVVPHQRLYDNPLFGNIQVEDQERFRARGWGRLVGRTVYTQFSMYCGVDCVTEPSVVQTFDLCYKSWLWLWSQRQGKLCADLAQTNFTEATTRFIGWPDRIQQRQVTYLRNLAVLTKEKSSCKHPTD